jgi:hypothetical protein
VVISEMLGVPYEDHEFFQETANAGLARYAAADAMQKGAMSLHQYLIDLVKQKQANPAEDAVSDLAERVTAGEISVKRPPNWDRPADRRARDDGQHDRHRHPGAAGEPGAGRSAAQHRRPKVIANGRGTDAIPVHHPERTAPDCVGRHRDRR